MNSKGHLYVSLLKSLFRIIGCIWSYLSKDLNPLIIFFFMAEILGVIEEGADKR